MCMGNKMKRVALLIIFINIYLYSQENIIVYPPNYIRTVIFQGNGDMSSIPIIKLGSSLTLEFDDIAYESKEYTYKIEHYTPFWEKSDLIYIDYITGYEENKILNFNISFNTIVNYTNYKLYIPNQDLRIKLTGNYLLKVFYLDKIIFSRPFIVYENKISISGEVKRMLNANSKKQQIIFNLSHENFKIDRYDNLEIIIMQNGNPKIKLDNIKPKFISKDKLYFNEGDNIIFDGNSEFRNVDIKDDMGSAMGVSYVEKKDIINFYLTGIIPKNNEEYSITPDINGKFVIRSLRANNQSTEADYAMVHFRVYMEMLDPTFNLFLYGLFNFWDLNEENKFAYNHDKKRYECSIILKQGFYDYTVISEFKNEIDYSFLDGSNYQTDNDYQILVYYKDIFERYYKVIGYYNLNSKTIRQ